MKQLSYCQLDPLAAAIAAGASALLLDLIMGFSMMGMMGSGENAGMGSMMMMPSSGWHMGFMGFGSVLLAALAGAVFAWVYNWIAARRSNPHGAGTPATQ